MVRRGRMKIAFINDQPEHSGMGEYATQLYEHLKDLCDIDYIFLKHSDSLKWNRYLSGYDLCHIANHNLSFLAKGRKAIITYHDFPYKKYFENPIGYYGRKFLYSWLKYAEHIICISYSSYRDTLKAYNFPENKITWIHCGKNDNFKPRNKHASRIITGLPQNKKIVLGVAAKGKRKNISTLINAFAILNERLRNTLLVKIGKSRRDNKRLVRKLGIEDKVKFIEYVPRADMPHYYNASDLFVFPSLWESFGLPALEAMASGVPIIASNQTSLPEVVGRGGFLMSPYNVENISEWMGRILNSKSLQDSLIEKGLIQAEKFSWHKAALETLEVYKKVGYNEKT